MRRNETKTSTTSERRLEPSELRAFLSRDWAALRDRKDQHWLDVARSRGGQAMLAAAESLREHVARHASRDADPRLADLEALIELKRRIDAASACLRR